MLRYALPRALTGAILVVAVVELAHGITNLGWGQAIGDDLAIYTEASRRLFSGGSWYLERQLAGPYPIVGGDVLYPPVTALFFGWWLLLPGWMFVAIPVAVTAAVLRPSPWGWVLIALVIAWPSTLLKTIAGNANVWVMMLVALALRFRWPGALILLKPSFLPLALIGIRSRGWWVGAGVLALLSLPFLAPTLDYPRVILDSRGQGLLYSLWDLPLALLPFTSRSQTSPWTSLPRLPRLPAVRLPSSALRRRPG